MIRALVVLMLAAFSAISGALTTKPTTSAAQLGAGAAPMNCFSSPGVCGYPDPKVGNVGVPAGTNLTPSGSITVTTPGTVISNLSVSGNIMVYANNVTIQNTRVTMTGGGCGTQNVCGNSDIEIEPGVTGTKIINVELTTGPGTTVQHAVRNMGGPTTSATGLYSHGPDEGWWGSGTIKDSYILCAFTIANEHVEAVYYGGGDGALVLNHDTLLNPIDQTAAAFGDTQSGPQNFTVTSSLLAGGGYTLYPAANTTHPGTATITNNRFARCLTAPVNGTDGEHLCSAGADSHGYYPYSGCYGPYTDLPPTYTVSGNYWDDNLAPIT